MGLSAFYKFTGSIMEKILKVLCLISWGVGGILYVYGMYDACFNTFTFPSGTKLILASWMLHLSLRFFSLWVPMGFLLIQWQMKNILALIGYVAGCLLAFIFSFVAFVLVLNYTKENQLREEYINLVNSELRNNEFPPSVKRLIESQNCCSLFGPTDFAPKSLFDIEDRVNTELEFMQDVALCYGGTFTVTKMENGSLMYEPSDENKKFDIPKGCQRLTIKLCYNVDLNVVPFYSDKVISLHNRIVLNKAW